MDNYQITKEDLTSYLSDSSNSVITNKVELWMFSSDDKKSILLTEIIDIIWKIIV